MLLEIGLFVMSFFQRIKNSLQFHKVLAYRSRHDETSKTRLRRTTYLELNDFHVVENFGGDAHPLVLKPHNHTLECSLFFRNVEADEENTQHHEDASKA